MDSFVSTTLLFLVSAIVCVPVSKRMGLGSVVGYLAAGMIIGPWGFGLVTSVEAVMHFAELGVVLFLFLIGLELNPSKLWELRRSIFGLGILQVTVCTLLFTLLGQLLFFSDWKVSFVAALGFSLSSTAIAVALMREKGVLSSVGGSASFSVLLFQDIAVIPMMAALPLLAVHTAGQELTGSASLLRSVVAIVVVIFAGRYLVRPVFRYIASTNLREVFTGFSLLLVLGTAALMHAVGLSMGLGTFLAGVLLAESEYRHELEIDIEPFKGLLVGLFFISVGMSVNFAIFAQQPLFAIGLTAALVLGKTVLLLGLARVCKLPKSASWIFATTLSQGGEFAFVLYGIAADLSIVSRETGSLLILAVAISMLTTPFLMMAACRFMKPEGSENLPKEAPVDQRNAVIIAGYGRVGQTVARIVHTQGIATTIVDHDPNQIELVRKFGVKAFYGDPTRLDLLHAAGAAEARLIVIALDDRTAALETVKLVQQHFPKLKIVARARNRTDAYAFLNLGVRPVRETFRSAVLMGEQSLRDLGYGAYEARVIADKFVRYDEAMVEKAAPHQSDERQLISLAKDSRAELEKLIESERARPKEMGDGWGAQ